MTKLILPHGSPHKLSADFAAAIHADSKVSEVWLDITKLITIFRPRSGHHQARCGKVRL